MKIIFLTIIALIVSSCASAPSRMESLTGYQPMVVAARPADGETAPPDSYIEVSFSKAVDPLTIGPDSFAVTKIDAGKIKIDELAADVSDGETDTVPGRYETSGDCMEAKFFPDSPFENGQAYAVVITSNVKTVDFVPLNQTPGGGPTPFFSVFYVTQPNGEIEVSPVYDEAPAGDGEGAEEEDTRIRPAWLVINELFYDAIGDEADGNLFVELAGEPDRDISGYSIVFVNGADGAVTETINIPDGSKIQGDGIFLIADSRTNAPHETNVVGADMLDNFDPQNGPDCAQLLDDHKALFDAVGYGSPLPQTAKNDLACFEGAPAADAPAGKSISRTNAADTNDNSIDFKVLDAPTPGFK